MKKEKKILRRRNEREERELNRILVTCLLGKIFNWPIYGAFLREGSLYRDTEFYKKLRSLHENEGLIELDQEDGKDKKEYRATITDKGAKRALCILTGSSTEELKWENICTSMKKYMPIFWDVSTIGEEERNYFLKILLLMYSDSLGESPQEYYSDLFNRFARDFLSERVLKEQNNFSKRLRYATTEFVEKSLLRRDMNERLPESIKEFLDKLITLNVTLNEIQEAVMTYYVYSPKLGKFITGLLMSVKRPSIKIVLYIIPIALVYYVGSGLIFSLILLRSPMIYLWLLQIAMYTVILTLVLLTSIPVLLRVTVYRLDKKIKQESK